MDRKSLLAHLQEKTACYELETLRNEYEPYRTMEISSDDVENLNRKFNLETLISIRENNGHFFGEPINERYLMKFRDAINAFMDEHAPDNEELKDYIRRLNCYRTFIQKIPMHPVNMSMPMGRVILKGKDYYCSAKKAYMNQPNSLCHFCVAKISEI